MIKFNCSQFDVFFFSLVINIIRSYHLVLCYKTRTTYLLPQTSITVFQCFWGRLLAWKASARTWRSIFWNNGGNSKRGWIRAQILARYHLARCWHHLSTIIYVHPSPNYDICEGRFSWSCMQYTSWCPLSLVPSFLQWSICLFI